MSVRLFFSGLVCALWLSSAPVQAADAQRQVLAEDLDHPWSMAFLPDNQGILITLQPGKLVHWSQAHGISAPVSGVPAVWDEGQGGLLDVVLDPAFRDNRRVWLSYTEADDRDRAGTVVGFGTLSDDNRQLQQFHPVFRQQPKLSTGNHFGGRMVFDDSGHLFIALGENNQRSSAQQLDKLQGKVVRLNKDGTVPDNNPLARRAGVRPEIWSYGHRNPQGLAINPWSGELWLNEHGPKGGDEVNIVRAGNNYGWPIATWGINYSGSQIPEAKGTEVEGTTQPVWYWAASPAISGMAFYNAGRFPQWQHKVFIGALKDKNIIMLSLEGDTVTGQQRILTDLDARVRDVRIGPDGYLYALTDERNGKLLKISPGPEK